MNTSISYETVSKIAKVIGRCDFRVMLSRYMTSDNCPWIITVGESCWQRHAVVEGVSAGISGADATLAILATEESNKFGYNIRTNNVVKRIELSELVANRYVGVKKHLYPSKGTVAVSPAQVRSMFLDKRLRITDSEEDTFSGCDTGVCKEVFSTDGINFAVRMDMDEAFMGQKECTIAFIPEVVTTNSVDGPLDAGKGGRRKIEIIG